MLHEHIVALVFVSLLHAMLFPGKWLYEIYFSKNETRHRKNLLNPTSYTPEIRHETKASYLWQTVQRQGTSSIAAFVFGCQSVVPIKKFPMASQMRTKVSVDGDAVCIVASV